MRYRTNNMKEEKYIKWLEASNNLSLILVFIGVLVGVGARSVVTLGIAAALLVLGGAGCVIFGHALEKLTAPTEEELRRKIAQLDEDRVVVYPPEYTFLQYLQEEGSTLSNIVEELDNNPNPSCLFEMLYFNYKETAGQLKVQNREQILRMLSRERKRHETAI